MSAVLYDRLSTKEQQASFQTHQKFLRSYAADHGLNVVNELYETHSAYIDWEKLQLFAFVANPMNAGVHLVGWDETRFGRSLEAAGRLCRLCKKHKITIHITGVETPYVCDPFQPYSSAWDRLVDGIKMGEQESFLKSERSKAYWRAKRMEVTRNMVAPDMLEVIFTLLFGFVASGRQAFYDAFNRVTPLGTTDERMGGDVYMLADEHHQEYVSMRAGEWNVTEMLLLFKAWNIRYGVGPRGAILPWTRERLEQTIVQYFGEDALNMVVDQSSVADQKQAKQIYLQAVQEDNRYRAEKQARQKPMEAAAASTESSPAASAAPFYALRSAAKTNSNSIFYSL